MSAGFKVHDKVYWGTNGAVEVCVEAFAAQSAKIHGAENPLSIFFREERDGFYNGNIVFLDDWIADATAKHRFLDVLDLAMHDLLQGTLLTDWGKMWVQTTFRELRESIAEHERPK